MLIFVLLLVFLSLDSSHGHGHMADPPGRSAAWQYGFDTPKNYNADELNCGGFGTQWNRYGGKCGPCGDSYGQKIPRSNEYGGKYGVGTIVKTYRRDSVIMIRIYLSTNHHGYFEFRICPDYKTSSQHCFDKYVLRRADKPSKTRFYVGKATGSIEMKYLLPKGFSCEHCLLQWFYRAENSWGNCPGGKPGEGAMGCGPQEEFRNCADIRIK